MCGCFTLRILHMWTTCVAYRRRLAFVARVFPFATYHSYVLIYIKYILDTIFWFPSIVFGVNVILFGPLWDYRTHDKMFQYRAFAFGFSGRIHKDTIHFRHEIFFFYANIVSADMKSLYRLCLCPMTYLRDVKYSGQRCLLEITSLSMTY